MRVRPIAPAAPTSGGDVRALVARAVDHPISGEPLTDLARGRRSATIIVPDATRKIPLSEIVPILIDRLRIAGLPARGTTILLACGTHPGLGTDAARELIGSLPNEVEVIEHDSRDSEKLVDVGQLRPGVPLRLHRAAVRAELMVTVGVVHHHYFAGFGGGPKMVFPGVAGHDEIQANHSLVLRRGDGGLLVRDPRCEPGALDGNPVADEIAHAADTRPPDMAVCLVEGSAGYPAWVGAGPWRASFEAAVERARTWFEIDERRRFDVVVASGGGAPSDSTLIQAHKGLDAACRFLAPGGRLLYAAAIDQGAGSTAMTPFLDDPRPDAILERLAHEWVQYGHTTLRLLERTSRFRVVLCSHLDPGIAERLGFETAADPQGVVDRWREELPDTTVAVMTGRAVYPSRGVTPPPET
jgi:nickel-dependent lactate racemase